jgi:hypothetical protein
MPVFEGEEMTSKSGARDRARHRGEDQAQVSRGRRLQAALLGAAVAILALPAAAAASTIGVANLEQVPVSSTGVFSQPPPYTVWQSGNRDGSTAFYASENGFLTEVSVGHWNTADVTVRIYIFKRDAGNAIKVAQNVTTMLLPAAPGTAPVVTTLPITTPVAIAAGDRIGMTVVSGGSSLHAIVDNLSPYPAPGVYPSTPPSTEPAQGDSYDFISSAATGPLIRGIVSPTPPTGGGPGTPRTTPLAKPIKLPVVKKNRKIVTSAHCDGLGIRSTCHGTVTVELDYQGNVVSVSKAGSKLLGSTTYDIPDGATQTIAVNLNKAGRSRLAAKGKLTAFLVLSEDIGGQKVRAGTRFTVKAKKTRKK